MLMTKRAIRSIFDNKETSLQECELLIQECKQLGFNNLAEEMENDLKFELNLKVNLVL